MAERIEEIRARHDLSKYSPLVATAMAGEKWRTSYCDDVADLLSLVDRYRDGHAGLASFDREHEALCGPLQDGAR